MTFLKTSYDPNGHVTTMKFAKIKQVSWSFVGCKELLFAWWAAILVVFSSHEICVLFVMF